MRDSTFCDKECFQITGSIFYLPYSNGMIRKYLTKTKCLTTHFYPDLKMLTFQTNNCFNYVECI